MLNSVSIARLVRYASSCPQRLRNWTGSTDYCSPGLSPLPSSFESFFPFVVRRRSFNPWVRHTGRYDRRFPGVGLLTMDEATLLYNYGLALLSGTVIEIGCWIGWSTAAWALSGRRLIVIDPVLDGHPPGESCRASLKRAGVLDNIDLLGAYSHEALARSAASGVRAHGIFIDGDHTGDGPLQDAMDATAVADDDCLITLHDMVLPNVAQALAWLRDHGWNCGIHKTAQFIGVAWRGAISPLQRQPDPTVDWRMLIRKRYPHLAEFPSLD